jgi:uncharacterized membrane protein YfhO
MPTLPSLENLVIPQEVAYTLFFLAIVLGLLVIKNLYTLKECRAFLLVFILFSILTAFLSYKRPIFFLPIYASIILAYASFSKNKFTKSFAVFCIVILFFSFFTLKPKYREKFELPTISEEGRVICMPVSTCLGERALYMAEVLLPMQGKEVITGWFPQSQSPKKLFYEKLLSSPLKLTDESYYELLRRGYVNTIIVKKDFHALVEYFNTSKLFEKIYENEGFVVFSPKERFSYLELNGKPLQAKIQKLKDRILIETECGESGILLIKESYHPGWRAWINGKSAKIEEDEYGFMKIPVKKGKCKIVLKFFRYSFQFK